MGSYVLILYIYANMLADGDHVSLTTAVYSSQARCEQAGQAASRMAGGHKSASYVCSPQ